MHIHTYGKIAEYFVMVKYFLSGYVPIRHRWKTKAGEIDIIFKRGKSIIFCEVKARSTDFPLERYVSQNQQNRLARAMEYFMSLNSRMKIEDVRFDLAIVKNPVDIKIYKNWLQY